MSTARLDRLLTRFWIGLAACWALGGGLHLGATIGPRCLPCLRAGMDPARAIPLIHRDPGVAGNPERPRP
jgi:hypothetical protein